MLGNIVAGVVLEGGIKNTANLAKLVMMGVDDGYGATGKHYELTQYYELTAEHIAAAAAVAGMGNDRRSFGDYADALAVQ